MKMDPRISRFLMVVGLLVSDFSWVAYGNLAFPVVHKFKGTKRNLSEMIAHDGHRHGRFLAAADFQLGGNGLPSAAGLYYTKIGLGTPPKDYHVQVDTGSDLLWVNGVECKDCPNESDLGIELRLYDTKSSTSSKPVNCDGDFCKATYNGEVNGCKPQSPCLFSITYGDGGSTSGYFVQDEFNFDQVDGDLNTTPASSSVVFGCGTKLSGGLGASADEALDGIIGFGQANASVLSQLAASKKVKKIFSHCLDSIHGGGIFAIGEVAEPKVNATPLIPGQAHYNAVMKDIEVDKDVIELSTGIFDFGDDRAAVIDSGTTLAYLPENIYTQLMEKVLAKQSELKLHTVDDQFQCFRYSQNVDDGFPVVKFHFENSLTLTAYPHDYLFTTKDDIWCIGWQKSTAKNKNGKDMTLLGDLVLSNRLVVYDLEQMTVGWTEYNCSTSIKVKDESGHVLNVGYHRLSSASTLSFGRMLTFLLLLIVMPNILMS